MLGTVIYFQHRRIAELLGQKQAIDAEILAVQQQMQEETDPARLDELEEILGVLTGSAERTVARISETDSTVAAAAVSGDTLEQDIRAILTPEQQQQADKLRADREAKVKDRRQQRTQ